MNTLTFTMLAFGLLFGVKHAFDADHIAAISTVVLKHKSLKKSSLVGMLWGFGHTVSLLVVGSIILLLKISIPQKIALSLEFIVGVMLVLLGINAILTFKKNRMHVHRHGHDGIGHAHFHSHKTTKRHSHLHLPTRQAMFIGSIHGLAGSAALTLLVLTSVNSVLLGLFYILIFGIGSIMGMILISSIISLPFALIQSRMDATQKYVRIGAGLICIVIGLTMMYNIGFVGVH